MLLFELPRAYRKLCISHLAERIGVQSLSYTQNPYCKSNGDIPLTNGNLVEIIRWFEENEPFKPGEFMTWNPRTWFRMELTPRLYGEFNDPKWDRDHRHITERQYELVNRIPEKERERILKFRNTLKQFLYENFNFYQDYITDIRLSSTTCLRQKARREIPRLRKRIGRLLYYC